MDLKKIVRPCILERKEYVPGKPVEEVTREYGITDIIKLASNENPLGTSPKAIEAMLREVKDTTHLYPESLAPSITAKLAKKFDLPTDHFYIDNGEDGVITMLGLTFINPGEECVMSELTFPAYENIVGKMDGKPVIVPMAPGYKYDIDAMLLKVTPKTKILFLCNPNNPTGTLIGKADFERILQTVGENTLIVADEAYHEFVEDPDYPQSVDYLKDHPNLIVLRTFSKIMGLAAVRIGYMIAHPEIIKAMLKSREPFPVNRPAQAGALASMDDHEFVEKVVRINSEGRKQIATALADMGFDVVAGHGNFVFADLKKPVVPVYEELLRAGVIIRPLNSQGAPNCIRVTIGTKEQNDRFIRSFKEAYNKVYSK